MINVLKLQNNENGYLFSNLVSHTCISSYSQISLEQIIIWVLY